MTGPSGPTLAELATPYALDAVSDAERADIEHALRDAPAAEAAAFREEVRVTRETMADLSVLTALEPPRALRASIMASIAPDHRNPWRTVGLAAAAAAVAAAVAFSVGVWVRPDAPTSVAEQVFVAPDVRSVSTPVAAGGAVTAVYSRARGAAVVVFDGVTPPARGSVYQLWLIESGKPVPAGVVTAPSTTEVVHDLGSATTLAVTAEPGAGSAQPTGQIFAQLPLS